MSNATLDATRGAADTGKNYILVSADTHCGADVWDYKPYLEQRYHEEFDAWASAYHDPWAGVDPDFPPEMRLGTASFEAPVNWESERRLRLNEEQGVVAEVLFPNTAPPFYPSGAITAPGPRTPREYELRWAGLRAHNRWLAAFCADYPGRRAGMAQIFLNDLDMAIEEVTRAKESGLMGVLLPGDHVLALHNLYYAEQDRLWAACADLELPVHRHGLKSSESAQEAGKAAVWVGSIENGFFGLRPIAHMICAGVFERFPTLKFVLTEMSNGAEVPLILQRLDRMVDAANQGGFFAAQIQDAHKALSRRPSEYYASNIYMANPIDFRPAFDAGTQNLLWGSDMPHAEGCSPYTIEALRLLFADLPEEQTRQYVGLRAIDVYGFDRKQLQDLADRFGPSPDLVAKPLTDEERPTYPMDTRCLTFSMTDTKAFATR